MTLRQLIAGLDEDLLDVQVLIKAPSSSGTYTQTLGAAKVTKDLKEFYHDGIRELDVKRSAIIIDTTPNPGV